MNSKFQHPSPESGCGVSLQTVQGASRSESTSPHPTAHSHNLHPYDDMGFVDPPENLRRTQL
jgi:hypothetical protein